MNTAVINIDQDLRDRFWARVDVQKGDACWQWVAGRDADGYGAISHNRIQLKAHRLSWELENGPIPERICVLHHCDNPSCVRPDHLWLGTQAENMADRNQKGRMGRACWRGHPWPENRAFDPDGYQICVACFEAARQEIWATGL